MAIYYQVRKATLPLQTVNIISTAKIAQELDLSQVAKAFPESEYNPDKPPNFVFFTKDVLKTGCIKLSRRGMLATTGFKNQEVAQKVATNLVKRMQKAGFSVNPDFKLNISTHQFSANIPTESRLNLYQMGLRLRPKAVYNPELKGNNYLYYNPSGNIKIKLGSTGYVQIYGTTEEREAQRHLEDFVALLNQLNLL